MEQLKNSTTRALGLVKTYSKTALDLLIQHWRLVAMIVLVVLIYCQGVADGKAKVQGQMDALKISVAEETAASNAAYAQKLKEANDKTLAWQAKATQADAALAAANHKTRTHAEETKKGIDDALAKDKAAKPCIDGFGTHGLQQYKQALGY